MEDKIEVGEKENWKQENLMIKKYTPITGKCKERLDNETCLGCNGLELYEFTGDGNCPLFRDEQIEIKEKGLKNGDRIYRNNNLYNT